MPELPEVETIRRQLVKELVGKKIRAVKILVPKLIKETSPAFFRRKIIGREIIDIRRRGKYLIFDLQHKPALYLQVHLKLSGQLFYSPPPSPHLHGERVKVKGKIPPTTFFFLSRMIPFFTIMTCGVSAGLPCVIKTRKPH